MRRAMFLLVVMAVAISVHGQETTQGALYATGGKGKDLGACPLKNTTVRADISGFMARVRVVQEFQNSFAEPIEAVYVFPLSDKGAVDEMTMTIGTRSVRGKIMRRDEAKKVYETAKTEGKTAGLLDQERPNIFTQSVANIMPGETIRIEIAYVETLKYEDGGYEFVFPMTVGPRYIPAGVTDAAKIKPPIAATRSGHDISINVNLNAGVPVEDIRSTTHELETIKTSPTIAKVGLRAEKVIPNKDFILRYDVTGKRIEDGVIAHRGERGGFFTLILQPPDKIASEDRTPKEIVFVLDTSGSMSGFPIEKAKEAMRLSLDGLYPDDTFNLITFSGDTHILFDAPVPATQANIEYAQSFLASRQGGGGTEMMKAVKAALEASDSKEHLRVVCFMTDGYVGNDNEIIAEIERHPNARVFSFGIGTSVNRFLLNKMAEVGNGEVEYVGLDDDGSEAAKRFYERVRSPLLTDISIDWKGMPAADVYPKKLNDLFSSRPVILVGRYAKGAKGPIKLRGKMAGQPYERDIAFNLPESETANDALATLWARQRIDDLSAEARGAKDPAGVNKRITDIGLEFKLMTQFTSIVAVEDRIVNQNGKPVKVEVPVEMPAGVDLRMGQPDVSVSGSRTTSLMLSSAPHGYITSASPRLASPPPATTGALFKRSASGSGSGSGYGYGTGDGRGPSAIDDSPAARLRIITAPPRAASSGVAAVKAPSLPTPKYPDTAKAYSTTGSVAVYVSVDERGAVTSAQAVSGDSMLRDAAIEAAKRAAFPSAQPPAKPVRAEALITYNFADPLDDAKTTASIGGLATVVSSTAPITEEMFREWRIKQKAHGWIFEVIQRLQKNTSPTDNEARFVFDGKARVLVRFNAQSADFKTRLMNLGFDPSHETPDSLTGTIPVERLSDLCDLDGLKIVLPKA